MATMKRNAPQRRRRATTQAGVNRRPDTPEDEEFEAQLEKILPSPAGGGEPGASKDVQPTAQQAAEQRRTAPAGTASGNQGVQRIAVAHRNAKWKAAVHMTVGGTRRKKRAKPTTSIFEAMEQQRNQRRCALFMKCWLHAFNPTARFKMTWDAGMLLLVIYSSFAVPYKTAFVLEAELREDPSSLGMTYREWLVDAIFYLDMILNFWTGYDTGYMIDTRKGKIALHYLTSRFPVDFLATIEWDLLVRLLVCGPAGCTGDLRSVNDYASLTRMLKVLRLARAGPLLSNLTSHTTMHSVYVDAGTFFLYVIVIAHVLACLFYMIPTLTSCDEAHEQVEGVWNMNYTCMPTSWRTNYELNDPNNQALMPMDSQYLSALYWSLTTMTTIGYGDRGPGNDPEIKFTLFAEIVGLCFFVLLLQEITSVYEESRRQVTETNAVKNEIVQFVKRSVPSSNSIESDTKARLIDKIVGFLRFKATSSSSREFDVEISPNFAELSEALQEEIRVAVFRPMLTEVRMFGRCSEDREDEENVTSMFREVDTDQSGSITGPEVRQLMLEHFNVTLSDAELAAAIDKMNFVDEGEGSRKGSDGSNDVGGDTKDEAEKSEVQITLDEFQQWWYLQKHGRPKIGPCPNEMLEWFALRLRSECASPCDRIVRKGEYGDRMFIVSGGSVDICDHDLAPEPGQSHSNNAFDNVPSSFGRILRRIDMHSEDRVFGLLSVLNEPGMPAQREFREIRRRMHQVAVYAGSRDTDYTEVLYFTSTDVIAALKRQNYNNDWDVGVFGEPIRYWQEVARNAYCKLYWHGRDDAYEWGRYERDAEQELAGKQLTAVSESGEKRGRGKGPSARAAGIAAGKFKIRAAGVVVRQAASSDRHGDSDGHLQHVTARQDRMVEEQMLIERKVSLLDQKVDDIARQQELIIEKMDAIANFMSPDLGQQLKRDAKTANRATVARLDSKQETKPAPKTAQKKKKKK